MKKYFLPLVFLFSISIFSCSEDPCENVSCVYGACVDGTCECDEGYEGTSCQTVVNRKYFGIFETTSNCGKDGTLNLDQIQFRSNGDGPYGVEVLFITDDAVVDAFEGTLQNAMLKITEIESNAALEISGEFTSTDEFTGSITVMFNNEEVFCDIQLER